MKTKKTKGKAISIKEIPELATIELMREYGSREVEI